jgi:hypothetical protein
MTRARISPTQIADLKARTPLPSLIGSSIALQRDTATEFVALCPFHHEDDPSFRVYLDHAHCFGCGWHGDAVSWLMEHERMSFPGAIRHLRELSGLPEPKATEFHIHGSVESHEWLPVMPVPNDAPTLVSNGIVRAFNPKRQGTSWEWTRWRPSLVHHYRNAAGELVGYVLRVEKATGGKFTPTITYRQHIKTGEQRWCVLPMSKPRPLYRLDLLAKRPNTTVLLVEGEKTADAAQKLLPSIVAMTWPGGSKSYHLADFASLRGRRVVCVPDNDKEGRDAFDGRRTPRGKPIPGILQILAGIGVDALRVEPPGDLPSGWDLADAQAQGWDTARTTEWIRANLIGARNAA